MQRAMAKQAEAERNKRVKLFQLKVSLMLRKNLAAAELGKQNNAIV